MNIIIQETKKRKRLVFENSVIIFLNDLIIPLILGFIIVFLSLELLFNLKETDAIWVISILLLTSIFIEISAIKTLFDINKLEEIFTDYNEGKNKIIVENIAKRLGWSVIKSSNDFLIFRNPSRIINSGENISIILDKNKILINSTCYSYRRNSRQLFSFGANRRNINKFKSLLDEVYAR